MQTMHREMLVSDILHKQQKTDSVKKQREDQVQMCWDKNLALREMTQDNAKKQRFTMQPITIESHQLEWQ